MNTLSDSARKSLFVRGPGTGLKFLFFAALSVAMIISDDHGYKGLQPLRRWTARALQPLLWAATLPRATFNLGDHLRSREDLLAENQALQQQQFELQARMLRMEALEAENARIRELLSSAASLQTRVLIAEILLVNEDAYRQIVLNKGERDGVYKGQALVDANGIMGQVIEVNPASSVALLITGLDGSVPVEVNRTGLQTIARGRGDGQTLSLPYLPGNADVKVGDLLVSSGLGGRFPPGYPVGKISELRHPAGESFMEGIAYPSARLDQGHQVLLVWAERPRQAAPAAAAAPEAVPAPAAAGAAAKTGRHDAASNQPDNEAAQQSKKKTPRPKPAPAKRVPPKAKPKPAKPAAPSSQPAPDSSTGPSAAPPAEPPPPNAAPPPAPSAPPSAGTPAAPAAATPAPPGQ